MAKRNGAASDPYYDTKLATGRYLLAYGHFGRTPDNEGGFSWERTDLVEELCRLS